MKTEDFEAAAMPHLNELFRTAVRLVRSRNEAEDLVQEAYMQAWKSFHRFETGTNCRAWLFKILLNKVKHQRRKWFRLMRESEAHVQSLEYEPPVPEHLSDGQILAALDKIPQAYRETIILVDVEEFSYKEAGYILSVPVGTVMSRLSRGRKLLRAELGEVAASYGITKIKNGTSDDAKGV